MRHRVLLAIAGCALVLGPTGCSRSGLLELGFGDPIGDGGFGGEGGLGGAGTGGTRTGGFGGTLPGTGGVTTGGFAGRGGFGGTGGFAGGGGVAGSSGGFAGSTGGFAGGGGMGGSGGGGPCNSTAECTSPDACTVFQCIGGRCLGALRDLDGDGYVDRACGGEDCNDLNPLANPGEPERCTDGTDNDCNGVADCSDPRCGAAVCGCVPGSGGENCQNGADDDCNGAVDCNDPGCVGSPECGCTPNEAGLCTNGIDDDCNGRSDCDDGQCSGTPSCQCRASREECTNGLDEDCDLLVDCADPSCASDAACLCPPTDSPEACENRVDDDCDGLVDCADPECTVSPACDLCEVENCVNGLDDDCDGAIDCADSGCRFDPTCAPTAEVCQNGLDDDRDGLADCRDPDCATNPACVDQHASCLSPQVIVASGSFTGDTTGHVGETRSECGGQAGEAVYRLVLSRPARVSLDTIGSSFDTTLYVRHGSCSAGREIACDDDGAGIQWASLLTFDVLQPGSYFVFVDGHTVDPEDGPDEGAYALNVDIDGTLREACRDGVDNDGDHYADCPDSECVNTAACLGCFGGGSAVPEFGISACTNGQDDDCDGVVDCADDDCNASPKYPSECCNGIDDNGNGIPDDFACRCAVPGSCPGDEVCYLHSVAACGPRCTDFVGNVCNVIAPGATCNDATQECEF